MTGRMLHDLVAMERKSFRIASQRGFIEMDPPLCGSALMSHNGSRSRHHHSTIGASAMKHAIHVVGLDSASASFLLSAWTTGGRSFDASAGCEVRWWLDGASGIG